jgi:flagellar protein FlaG
MTAVSSAPSLSSLIRVAQPVAPRPAEGTVSVKSSAAVVNEASKTAHTVNEAQNATKSPASSLSKEEVASQVHDLQLKMDKLNPALAFTVDQSSGRALIQLTDRITKEVIKQFPTEAAIQISKALDRFQKGQLVSRKA